MIGLSLGSANDSLKPVEPLVLEKHKNVFAKSTLF
jgi:hypothetical protein